jgi:AraC-like DNA-binding protein
VRKKLSASTTSAIEFVYLRGMELINEFIYLDILRDEALAETSCIALQDEHKILITYAMAENDCLFDFSATANKVHIHIHKAYFEKYDKPFDLFIEKQSICCNTQSKLFELINCSVQGIARNVYLESIVLYLLFQVQKNNLVFQLNCDSCTFLNKPVELDKIQKAKDYILSNLDQNMSISTLTVYAGTNQCYLKKGFKEVVGQTIFEFIQENRMVKAMHLLQHTQQSVADVAASVGYASTSSFSQTFKHYFGITPSLVQKVLLSVR